MRIILIVFAVILCLILFGVWAVMATEDQPQLVTPPPPMMIVPSGTAEVPLGTAEVPLGTADAATIASAITIEKAVATDDSKAMAVVDVFRARWPLITTMPRIELTEAKLNAIVTTANVATWPDLPATELAYTTMRDRAATPTARQNWANELIQAKRILMYVQRLKNALATGFICGRNAAEATMMGCKLVKTSQPMGQGCDTWWAATATATRDSANITPGATVCLAPPTIPVYSLVSGPDYPDPRGVYNAITGKWAGTAGAPRNIYAAHH